MSGARLAGGAIAIAIAGAAVYFIAHEQNCQTVEDHYLSAVSDAKGYTASAAFVDDKSVRENIRVLRELSEARIRAATSELYEQCGKARGDAALAKASSILQP